MADVRNFRKYLEELSGNNLLLKKVAALEKRNATLEKHIQELKEDMKLLKKHGLSDALPKKKGRKPRPMIRVIEDEMLKSPGHEMAVKDIVKLIKKKSIHSKATNVYSSVASSLTQSPKFEKVGPGVFRLTDAPPKEKKKPGRKPGKKKKDSK